jgi:branched-chain amino acid transport system substrate-binding protein
LKEADLCNNRAWRERREEAMPLQRRTVLKGMMAAGITALGAPAVRAQPTPIRIGLLTVKVGPLAEAGVQMEQGIATFLKDKNYTLAGRKVDFVSADTGGDPSVALDKAREFIEINHVDFIFGPLVTFELLTISDYVAQHKTPMMSLAGADAITQRRPNPYFVRATASSSQAMHPMGHYAATEMKLKRVATICEDFFFCYEQMGGFQQVFQDNGGQVVKKLWTPLITLDDTPYIKRISDVDGVCQGFTGSNPLKFMKQYSDSGLNLPVCGGETAGDDSLLTQFGDDAIGLITASPYTIDFDSDANSKFKALMSKDYNVTPGFYAAGLYVTGMVVEAAMMALHGDLSNKEATIEALRAVRLGDTPRGPLYFDDHGNVVGNVFIRRIEKAGGKLTSVTLKTYENIGQFWPYKEQEYLRQPAYSREWPPVAG